MERRVLLAIFLAFLVLYVWQALFVKPVPKPGTAGNAPASTGSPAAGTSTASPTPQAAAPGAALTPEAPAAVAAAPAAKALVGETSERDVRVETRSVIAVFTNKGARLKSWRLKRYLDHQGQPQELVENTTNHPLPFSLRTTDEAVNATLNTAIYTVAGDPSGPISSPIDLRFEYRDVAGVQAVKEFHLDPDAYIVAVHAEVKSGDRELTPAIVWGPAVGDISETSRYTQKAEGLIYQNDKAQRLATKDLLKQSEYDGDFRFAGVDDNYFMTVVLAPGASKVRYLPVAIPPTPPSTAPPRELVSYEVEPKTAGQPIKYFVGPKDFDVLAAIGPDLTKAINFGMFTIIVVPLLRSLKWVNGFVGNYGFSIIILTILINVIMFPLRHKSVVSMRKMQEIQPEVKAIQDRYAKLKATDPAKQKMNQELMALYRDRGVNPAGGCVPML
jgi:YidC/Oxa1 family membrane protein insertase